MSVTTTASGTTSCASLLHRRTSALFPLSLPLSSFKIRSTTIPPSSYLPNLVVLQPHQSLTLSLRCSSSLSGLVSDMEKLMALDVTIQVSSMDCGGGLSIYPLHRCKTLHIVRHAQGVHNVDGEKNYKAYMSPEYFDAPLTPLGWQQVDNLRKHVRSCGLFERIDLVITSPLLRKMLDVFTAWKYNVYWNLHSKLVDVCRYSAMDYTTGTTVSVMHFEHIDVDYQLTIFRTMQTAVGVFGGEGYTDRIDSVPLMVANAGNSDRPAISSLDCPPIVAVELCREHCVGKEILNVALLGRDSSCGKDEPSRGDWFTYEDVKGVHPCDGRRSISDYQYLFPAMDFSQASTQLSIESDEDILWTDSFRETTEELAARGMKFMDWLWTRKEKEIAIVTHSGFLVHTLNAFGNDCHPLIKKEMCKRCTVFFVKDYQNFPSGWLKPFVDKFMHSHELMQLLCLMKYATCICSFANCELRSMIIVDKSMSGSDPSTTNYPGKIPPGPDVPSTVADEKNVEPDSGST
ncbi:hypothetical protein RHSIM_Rhsim05G0095400 [Rhododendron simsii]|uniref:Phosphoglycerate mutase-like protein 1 n=1 Tax=Rhododendron simsii TaxID=118357 RepID=A0A834GZP7_RHOSS|nr:hypothetical protein RHSIM_Rhsim05G0095400 [Rhododendron simsii]